MYVIVGASSGVGRAIAEVFAANGCDLLLVSRAGRDIEAVAADLALRFGVSVKGADIDLSSPNADFSEILDAVAFAKDRFKGALFPAGAVLDSDTVLLDTQSLEGLFRINCLSVCSLINEILRVAHKDCGISLVGFGSVASVRGRGSNMAYSAAKAATRFYFEGLRHACAGKKSVIQFYVLGYMDTNLAFAYNVPLPKGDPHELAKKVYRDIHNDIGEVFYPRYWSMVTAAIKLIPWAIYKHLKF